MKGLNIYIGFVVLMAGVCSCKKFLHVDTPENQLVSSTVFTSDSTAKAAVTAIYRAMMMQGNSFANGDYTSLSFLCGLSADELANYSTVPDNVQFFENALTPENNYNYNTSWQQAYQYIYFANAAIEGLQASDGVSAGLKNQLMGEAKFARAFCHFYLTNMYGDVPLVLSTNYLQNQVISRSPQASVYSQIVSDLKDAENLMAPDYSFAGGERVRPNKYAAAALLARVYLYTDDYGDAVTISSLVINNPLYALDSSLNDVFLKNSTEAIWQLQPVVNGYNTFDGNNFILTTVPTNAAGNSAALSTSIMQAFETGDLRRQLWVDSLLNGASFYYFPYKYKIKTGSSLEEYSMVLRLAEQYLIRAEAKAGQNDLPDALTDLNVIRARAGLPAYWSASKDSVLAAIVHERQVELFSEWGHRWFDLKRLNLANTILVAEKPAYWKLNAVLYPIPQTERQNDPNLTQNAGY